MSVVRARVVAKNYHYDGHMSDERRKEETKKSNAILLSAFIRRVDEAGIKTRYKECQSYESKGEKRRRKRREADLQRRKEKENLRASLRDHFGGA